MRRLSDIENETDENLPKNEDIQLPTGKVVRIRRRHLDPNSKGQLISKCLSGVIILTKKPTNFF